MTKILLIVLLTLIVSFLLFFPFWHVGGTYYRGLLLIYDIRPASGGLIPAPDFLKEITLIKWADPTSFQYVGDNYAKDRFSVYVCQYRIDGSDSKTFHQIQAPITDENWYLDEKNVRGPLLMKLKRVSGDRDGNSFVTDNFDIESFQPLGNYIFKDKNGVYSYFRIAPFSEDMKRNGWGNLTIDLYKKHEELDAATFKLESCEERTCRANDKNGIYSLNRTDGSSLVNIKKVE